MPRMSVDVNDEVHGRIEEIRQKLGVSSLTDVVRSAFRVFAFLIDERDAGSQIIVRRRDGTEREVVFL